MALFNVLSEGAEAEEDFFVAQDDDITMIFHSDAPHLVLSPTGASDLVTSNKSRSR